MAERLSPNPYWSLFREPVRDPFDKDLERRLRLEFVTKGAREWEREYRVCEDIYNRHLKGLDYHGSFQKFLDIFIRISDIHLPLQKENAPRSVAVLSRSQAILAELLSMEHAEEVPEDYLNKLREQAQLLEQSPYPTKWYFPKVNGLAIRLAAWKDFYSWIDNLTTRIDIDESKIDLVDLRASCDQITARINEDSAYGIKTCYFQSPLFLKSSQAFVVFDERLNIDNPEVATIIPEETLAHIVVADRPTQKVEAHFEQAEFQHGVKANLISITGAGRGFGTILCIMRSGEIKDMSSLVPIAAAFEKKGAAVQFELWRAFMLLRMYDLTRHADVIEKMPSVSNAERDVAKGEGGILGIGRKVKSVDYKTLMLPRIKFAESAVSKSSAEEEERQKRFVDRYHVTWFVRRLPLGYHASVQAIEYAGIHQVQLKENETIVREHWRGGKNNGDEVSQKPIKAVFRK